MTTCSKKKLDEGYIEVNFHHTTWKVILKALLRKAFKINHFSVLA